MATTDPIADMLTTLRNALTANHAEAEVPYCRLKEGIARVMVEEGFLRACKKTEEGPRARLRLYLKYGPEGQRILHELKRASRPGLRAYAGVGRLPRVREGIGIAIVSTPQGVLSDRACRERKLGGEVLCTLW
jgi:small subunit ribosomal protein S8